MRSRGAKTLRLFDSDLLPVVPRGDQSPSYGISGLASSNRMHEGQGHCCQRQKVVLQPAYKRTESRSVSPWPGASEGVTEVVAAIRLRSEAN